MVSDPYQRAIARGCMGSLLWQLLALAASALFVGLFIVVMLGSTLLPVEPWIQSALGGALVFVFLFGFVGVTLAFAASRARVLDPAFARLGISGSAIGINGRQYHGSVRGRRLDAMYFRGSRGGGPLLQLHVECRVMTKLAAGTRTRAGELLGELLGLDQLELGDPAYAGLVASAADPGFARGFFGSPAAKPTLLGLLTDPRGREMRSFVLRPGVVSSTQRFFDPSGLTSDELARKVDSLIRLAELLEASPAPSVSARPGAFEQSLRESPGRTGCLIAVVLIAVAALVCAATVALVTLADSSSQGAPGPKKPGSGRRR